MDSGSLGLRWWAAVGRSRGSVVVVFTVHGHGLSACSCAVGNLYMLTLLVIASGHAVASFIVVSVVAATAVLLLVRSPSFVLSLAGMVLILASAAHSFLPVAIHGYCDCQILLLSMFLLLGQPQF